MISWSFKQSDRGDNVFVHNIRMRNVRCVAMKLAWTQGVMVERWGLIDFALRKYVEIMNYSDSLRHGRKYEICCHCDFEVGYRSFGELIVIMELEKLK